MKLILVLCLASVFFIMALVGCAFPNENNEANDDIAKSERHLIDVLEDIAVMRPSLDEFKQMYPDCRVLREDIDGSYSNIVVSTSKMPNILVSFCSCKGIMDVTLTTSFAVKNIFEKIG